MFWKLVNALSCAFRGRYKDDGATEQQLEVNDEFANCLTAVQKDSLVLEVRSEENIGKRMCRLRKDVHCKS